MNKRYRGRAQAGRARGGAMPASQSVSQSSEEAFYSE